MHVLVTLVGVRLVYVYVCFVLRFAPELRSGVIQQVLRLVVDQKSAESVD